MNEQTIINTFAQLLWANANEQQRSFLHAIAAGNLYNDFCMLQNTLDSSSQITYIQQKVIDNAEEYYKQLNKSLLIFRDLSCIEKQIEESKIDIEARNLKNKWINNLQNRNIHIIQ